MKQHLPLRQTDLGGEYIGGEEEKNKVTFRVYVHNITVKLEVTTDNYYYYGTS